MHATALSDTDFSSYFNLFYPHTQNRNVFLKNNVPNILIMLLVALEFLLRTEQRVSRMEHNDFRHGGKPTKQTAAGSLICNFTDIADI
jgi:hypothetical protein